MKSYLLFFITLTFIVWGALSFKTDSKFITDQFAKGVEETGTKVAAENDPRKKSVVHGRLGAPQAELPSTSVLRGDERQRVIRSLPDWAATYDKAALEKVKEFVFSPDEEIRTTAIDAIVAIGIPEGADVLEEALKSITIPQEIIDVREKVKFLRLPSPSR